MEALNIKADGVYLDTTFGRGGHTRLILQQLGREGRVVAMDRDPQAVAYGREEFRDEPRLRLCHTDFHHLEQALSAAGVTGTLDGVVADLGVSSPQLDDKRRGFAFMHDGPLDMRMDSDNGLDAATWLRRVEEADLQRVIRAYGEERYARRIASAIVSARRQQRLVSTRQLAEVIAAAVPTREPGKHPATRTFQAIRIYINDELAQLRTLLPKAVRLLAAGGRLAVISFHSLEDRIVKRFLREESRGDPYPPDLPVPASAVQPRLRLVGRAIHPAEAEIQRNPRARSAVLRVAERTEVACG